MLENSNQKHICITFENSILFTPKSLIIKKIIILIILFSILKTADSQEHSFPFYFEDAIGNKDTLYFGFDETASFDIDENLGEMNLINQPYDSTFFTFFTDAVTNESWFCDLMSIKYPTYISKKQYVNIHNSFFIEIGIIAKNWPLKISWEKDSISSFDINAYSGYSNHQILASGFYPPGGWFDATCCGSAWANHYLVLSDTTDYSIDQNLLCTYEANINNDQINLFYIGFIDKTTSIMNLPENKIDCWYEEKQGSIRLQNIDPAVDLRIELFDLYGSKIIDKLINTNSENQTEINISHLNNGIYILRIYDMENTSFKNAFKIVKQ